MSLLVFAGWRAGSKGEIRSVAWVRDVRVRRRVVRSRIGLALLCRDGGMRTLVSRYGRSLLWCREAVAGMRGCRCRSGSIDVVVLLFREKLTKSDNRRLKLYQY